MRNQTIASASKLLSVDSERTVAALENHLKTLCAEYPANGILIGVSGGIDSSLLAGLAVRTFGREFVHGMYLYDPDSEAGHGSNARGVADWLGIELVAESIENAGSAAGTRSSWPMRFTRLSPFINRAVYSIYHGLARETGFVSSLRAGSTAAGGRLRRGVVLRAVDRYADELFYARHRYRREVLESRAEARKWLLLGAANRSEWEVGWLVKDGVDDLPHQPLIGLYKTQVRQLASHLAMPPSLQGQVPSPDMARGITDEYALGLSYSTIDLALDYLAGGLKGDEVLAAGVTQVQLQQVREMKELSAWKRRKLPEPLPVDGSRSGGLR